METKLKYYTSYYGMYKNIPKDYLCVGISRIIPEWFKNNEYRNFIWTKDNFLAPSYELLKDIKDQKIDTEEYTRRYVKEIHERIKPYTGFDSLEDWLLAFDSSLANQEDWKAVVFMCYELPNDFCHRHIISKIFSNYYKLDMKEFRLNSQSRTNELF